MRQFIFFLVCLGFGSVLNAQCSSSVSANGFDFTVDISLTPVGIVVSNCNEPYGFNYDLQIQYSINLSGADAVDLDNLSFTIPCDNGTFTNIALPRTSASGTVTTSQNQYTNAASCSGQTAESLGCDEIDLNISSYVGITAQTVDCAANNMPIELAGFTVKGLGSKAVLNWSTNSETNNDYFTIERSQNGQDWEQIATVDGAGTTTEPKAYEFVDPSPYVGTSYYVLKQTDFDGQFSLSDVAVLARNTSLSGLRLFPNPSSQLVRVEGLIAADDQLEVINMFGQNVKPQVSITFLNESSADLDISNLPKGFYFINGQKFLKQ